MTTQDSPVGAAQGFNADAGPSSLPRALQSGLQPTSSHPPRRRSDSTLTWEQRADQQGDGRAKLQQWAAEALEAPPPLVAPWVPTSSDTDMQATSSLGRRPRVRSRSPADMKPRIDTEGLYARRKSVFNDSYSEQTEQAVPDTGRLAPMSPISPIKWPDVSSPQSATMATTLSSPADAQMGLAQRRLESGHFDASHMRTMANAAAAQASSHKFHANGKGAGYSSLAQDNTTPRAAEGAFVTTQNRNPTIQTRSNRSSQSEGATETSRSASTASITPFASRVQSTLQGTVPQATHAPEMAIEGSPLSAYLRAGTDGRRGSSSFRRDSASASSISSNAATAHEEAASPVPALSQSTLANVGAVPGLTPPKIPQPAATGEDRSLPSASESGSVVSAGLEMGLGTSHAKSVLGASAAATAGPLPAYVESRASRRPSAAGVAAYLERSGRRGHDSSPSFAHPSRSEVDAVASMPMSSLALSEAELSRRKTTGCDTAHKARRDVPKRQLTDAQEEATSMSPLRSSQSHQYGLQREISAVLPMLPMTYDSSELSRAEASSTRSSFDSRDTHLRASRTGSTQLDTPSLSGKAMFSPEVSALAGIFDGAKGAAAENEHVKKAKEALLRSAADGGQASFGNNGGLMGSNVGGHFGPGVRAKVIDVLEPLIAAVPLSGMEGETISLAEYGCLNSRSIPMMQLIISKFSRHFSELGRRELDTVTEEGAGSTVSSGQRGARRRSSQMGFHPSQHRHVEPQSSPINFTVVHEDDSSADFRPVIHSLDTRSDSYMDSQWQSMQQPSLRECIFSSFVGRPFASRIAPPNTMHFGISLMDLHWIHTPLNRGLPLATSSQAELVSFLKARALEFKPGGVLMVAYLARSENLASISSGYSRKAEKDIWTKLTNTLAPCIQRLVSCGMLKSDVARYLLDLPLHPRTPSQTQAALDSVSHLWNVEWSCGLGRGPESSEQLSSTGLPPSEPQPLRIAHPAWKAFQAGTLSQVSLAEHTLMIIKNLYESHFRAVLREHGKLSKGAVEFVLDSLWDILSSKFDDPNPTNPMEHIEIEVSICALRRA